VFQWATAPRPLKAASRAAGSFLLRYSAGLAAVAYNASLGSRGCPAELQTGAAAAALIGTAKLHSGGSGIRLGCRRVHLIHPGGRIIRKDGVSADPC
jgi:hypothetical protein